MIDVIVRFLRRWTENARPFQAALLTGLIALTMPVGASDDMTSADADAASVQNAAPAPSTDPVIDPIVATAEWMLDQDKPRLRAAALVMEKLDYVGVLTIEFFVVDGRLVINEMAPRVHNSGHWSLGGARTSQFENHIRALLDWPLGDTDPLGEVAMLNLVGRLPDPLAVLAVPGTSWHDYGKTPRSGRKLGHVTVTAPDTNALESRLDRLRGLIAPPGD